MLEYKNEDGCNKIRNEKCEKNKGQFESRCVQKYARECSQKCTQKYDIAYDIVIVGGGPAGMAAALSAHRREPKLRILLIERDKELGGILNQCIHNGFGLHYFKQELTGPEYAQRFIEMVRESGIQYLEDSMVLKIASAANISSKIVHAINSQDGYMQIATKAVVLAMGCRERSRGAVRIHGARVAGVYTAGTAQRLINIDGYMPGKKVVILGSGDIGLVMARRMTLEGAAVVAVIELLAHSNGLTSNVVQCLHDYHIPLLLSHTITRIHGQYRVTGVTIAKVDEQLQPIEETERFIACDTVLLAVGLVPENEISRATGIDIDAKTGGAIVGEMRQTNVDGVFACGNVLHVHDLVDFVTGEGELAGEGAVRYVQQNLRVSYTHTITPGDGISYVVPQRINVHNVDDTVRLFMRVNRVHTGAGTMISARLGEQLLAKKRELKFLPAEMISLDIKKEDLIAATDAMGKDDLTKMAHAPREIVIDVSPAIAAPAALRVTA